MEKPEKPFPQSYWVHSDWLPERFLCAGHYPGDIGAHAQARKLTGLLRCQIRRVINLIADHETSRGGQPFRPYEAELQELAAAQGLAVTCTRMGYADGSTPTRAHMRQILDAIDAAHTARAPVYVHCWGGHGRTGSVVACHLIRHGYPAQTAIDQIVAWRAPLPRNHFPFEGEQEAFVRSWQRGE